MTTITAPTPFPTALGAAVDRLLALNDPALLLLGHALVNATDGLLSHPDTLPVAIALNGLARLAQAIGDERQQRRGAE